MNFVNVIGGVECYCNKQVEFPPDLCSRVTFVNFTVTRSSLQSQCLNQVLKAERPDVDSKRSDLLKLQGHFPVYHSAANFNCIKRVSSVL